MRIVPAHIQDALASDQKIGEYKVAGRITVEPSWWLHASSALPPRYAPIPTGPYTESQVYGLFHYYGYTTDSEIANAVENPPPTETAAQRVTRITNELNAQTRTWTEVETSIRGLPQIVETGQWQHSKTPLRWWQKADNSQVEVEIPNIRNINIDRSFDSAAAQLTFTISNQKMRTNAGEGGVPTELGQPGYYWPLRGQSPESRSRWGQEPNEWRNVLVQNALLRVYMGYGGEDKPLADALTDGNLMIEGVFLIDSVRGSTDGTITIRARDMMRLLIEQQLFVPLVPLELYPLSYFRWLYKNVEVHAQARDTTSVTPGSTSTTVPSGPRQALYADSSTDWWSPTYGGAGPGSNWALHGHFPAEAIDGDPNTYWMSNGNARPDADFAFDWIEFDCGGEAINAVYLFPWGGNYTCYVSVMENGSWQGDPNSPIPYDPSELYSTQTTVDTGAAIPYVATFTVPWEEAGEYWLPNMYAAQRVRITFHNGFDSGIGPYVYREGLREFGVLVSSGAPQTTGSGQALVTQQHLEPLFFAADAIPGPYPRAGFITCDTFGQVDAFGDARILPKTGGGGELGGSTTVTAIRFTPTGNGYYIMDNRGHIACYGDAQYFGRTDTDSVLFDMAVTSTGLGYWLLGPNGQILQFGDATPFPFDVTAPAPLLTLSIEATPTGLGCWVLRTDGHIDALGSAVHHGQPSALADPDSWVRLRRTSTGDGYWVLSNYGRVEAFGDATDFGGITTAPTEPAWSGLYWGIMPGTDDLGYEILRGDGAVFPAGTIDDFGGPVPGTTAELRYDGNYRFYEDIIKDLLLWSGFWLKEDLGPLDEPQVFGTIEGTGVYAHDTLDPAIFDKKPVIDAINTIKEIVGYHVYLSPDGGFNFVAPNVFQAGNFLDDGTHTNVVPEVDERIDLFDYGVELPAGPLRSEIIISSEKVDPHTPSTLTVSYTPPTAQLLHGMVRPAIWTNKHFDNRNESRIMAELIALQIYFQLRLGTVHAWYNPAIGINDQIRVMERQTSETYFQWVRGVNITMDLDAGTVYADYTTSWLGTESEWSVGRDTDANQEQFGWIRKFILSERTISWLQTNPRKIRVPELRGPLDQGPTYGSGSNLGETPSGTGAAGGP